MLWFGHKLALFSFRGHCRVSEAETKPPVFPLSGCSERFQEIDQEGVLKRSRTLDYGADDWEPALTDLLVLLPWTYAGAIVIDGYWVPYYKRKLGLL